MINKSSPLTPEEFTLAKRYAIYFPSLIRLDTPKTFNDSPTRSEDVPDPSTGSTTANQDTLMANSISNVRDTPDIYFSQFDPFSIDAYPMNFEDYGIPMV